MWQPLFLLLSSRALLHDSALSGLMGGEGTPTTAGWEESEEEEFCPAFIRLSRGMDGK